MPAASESPAWQALSTNAGPTPRYEQAMQYNAASQQVFVFAGRDGSQDFNDVWALDINTLTWREIAAASPVKPPARHSTVMIVSDDGQTLYIATGQGATGNLNDVWKLDLTTETWQDLTATAGPAPEARYGNPGGNLNDNLVLTHGFGTTRYDTTWRFNTQSEIWENITPATELPLRRCLFAATSATTTRLVIHGGCASGFGDCYLEDTWVLDTVIGAWRQIQSEVKPAGRQHHTIVATADGADGATGGSILLFAGQGADGAARNDLWSLNLENDSWSPLEIASGPQARYNQSAVWVPGSGMLVFGGRDNNRTALGDLWLLTLDPATLPSEAPSAPVEAQPTAIPDPTPTPELISPSTGPEHDADGG
jgi:N-acetylneuraminic acid mutarotase